MPPPDAATLSRSTVIVPGASGVGRPPLIWASAPARAGPGTQATTAPIRASAISALTKCPKMASTSRSPSGRPSSALSTAGSLPAGEPCGNWNRPRLDRRTICGPRRTPRQRPNCLPRSVGANRRGIKTRIRPGWQRLSFGTETSRSGSDASLWRSTSWPGMMRAMPTACRQAALKLKPWMRADSGGTYAAGMGQVRVGTASWTDRTLISSGWYPPEADTPERRLRYYARQFPLVEVDATYYALPAEQTAAAWAARTPARFTFNIKAFSLFTQHPTRVAALPADLRPAAEKAGKDRVYLKDVDPAVAVQAWDRFLAALEPLREAGKLGTILLQFPHSCPISRSPKDYIRS